MQSLRNMPAADLVAFGMHHVPEKIARAACQQQTNKEEFVWKTGAD
jgi:hypothetical protein